VKDISTKTMPRRARAPKAKAFVNAPFVKCPDCGEPNFGVLMVCGGIYTRRCTNCWFDKDFALPLIRKKIIYLDQFVISNMMKELDPDRPDSKKGSNDGFYRTLFETLDRLSKLQLIACPDSPVQDHESLVDTRYEKIRAVFRKLSLGFGFVDPETIYLAQVFGAFESWLKGETARTKLEECFVFQGNPHVWQERFQIELHYVVPGLVSELKGLKATLTKQLHGMCEQWKEDKSFSFQAVFECEFAGSARKILSEFFTHLARYAAVQRGEAPIGSICCWPESVDLVTRMLSALASSTPTKEDQFRRIQSFFASEYFRAVPFARVSGLLWASLARDVNAGRQPKNFPGAGMYNDIDVIAAYAPFCDAMFVDKEVAHLAAQAELKKELLGQAQLFSLRKNEQVAFIEFLKSIEAGASPNHLKLVREVYGEDWGSPFVELLSFTGNTGRTFT
jgi:hypothetical protein